MHVNRRDIRLAVALFCVLTCWFWLTASAHTYIADGETMLAVTESLAERGSFTLTFPPGDTTPRTLTEGLEGQQYAITGPLQSILALPFYQMGHWISSYVHPAFKGYFTRFFVLLFNAPIHAATASLLCLFSIDLGFRRRTACFLALTYALATISWPYARTFYAETLHTFWLVLATWAVYRYVHTHHWLWITITGLAIGLGIATKYVMVVAVPAFVLYLTLTWLQRRTENEHRLWPWRTLVTGGLPCALILALLLFFNHLRFGNLLETGYTTTEMRGSMDTWAATAQPLVSLYSMFFSSGRGFFFFSPPIVLTLWGIGSLLRRRRDIAILMVCIAALYPFFYALATVEWYGGGNWGPRYIVCITPFVLLPLGAYIERRELPRWWRVGSAAALFVAGFWVQFSTVAVNYSTYLFSDIPANHQHYYPHYSPLAMQWRLWPRMIQEWQQYDHQARGSDRLFYTLAEGFYPVEVASLAPFGRWTRDTAQIYIQTPAQQPLEVHIQYSRPHLADSGNESWAGLVLYYDHTPVIATRELIQETATERQWRETLTLSAEQVTIWPGTLSMATSTWQPPGEERELGVFLSSIEVYANGVPVPFHTGRLPAPLPVNATLPWRWEAMLWFYDPVNAHPADLWAVYITTIGLAPQQAHTFVMMYGGVLLCGLVISAVSFLRAFNRWASP